MKSSLIIKLIVIIIFGLFILWKKSKRRNNSNILISRLTDNSNSSFSLMTILTDKKADVKINLKKLIETSDYKIVEIKNKKQTFNDWNDSIYFETENIKKGVVELKELTIFNDPESIIITDKEKIRKLSFDLNCKIIISIWERVSMTVVYEEYEKGSLLTSTTIISNKPYKNNLNSRLEFINDANKKILQKVLIKTANELKDFFDNKELEIIEYTLKL
tara:strand:+ start:112 stop:765 length:654 start_codon:yes stop_codon:yes gene_type:complete